TSGTATATLPAGATSTPAGGPNTSAPVAASGATTSSGSVRSSCFLPIRAIRRTDLPGCHDPRPPSHGGRGAPGVQLLLDASRVGVYHEQRCLAPVSEGPP